MSEKEVNELEGQTIKNLQAASMKGDANASAVLLNHVLQLRSLEERKKCAESMAKQMMSHMPRPGRGETMEEYNRRVENLGLSA